MAVFITGAGTPPNLGPLPSGYVPLNYLQSSGSQYIDTGIKGKSGIKVVTKIIPVSTSGNTCIIGSIYNNGTRYNCGIGSGKFEFQYGTQYGASSTAAAAGTEYELEIQWVYNDGYLKVNGATAQTRTGSSGAANHNLYMFARNNGGNADRKASIKMYHTEIYDNGTLVKDFYPCINPQDVCGMYDLVSGSFTSGSGSFTGG